MNYIQLLITLRLWVAGPPVSKVDRQVHLISSDHITSCSPLRNSGIPHWFITGWFYSLERLCFIGYTLCLTSIYSTGPFRGWMGHASGWWVGNKVTSQVTMRPWTKRPRLSQLVLKQTLKQRQLSSVELLLIPNVEAFQNPQWHPKLCLADCHLGHRCESAKTLTGASNICNVFLFHLCNFHTQQKHCWGKIQIWT
jgi:hypothetical protein